VIAALEWGLLLLRPEHGLLAILQILAPHLALVGLVLVPISLLALRARSIAATAALFVVVALRFGGDWLSVGAAPTSAAQYLDVITWNLEAGATAGSNSAEFLKTHDADVVALQELQYDAAAAIAGDPLLISRYPYRRMSPRDDVLGMGLLSRFPIIDSTIELDPAFLEARIDVGGGRTVVVFNAHPLHADIQFLGPTSLPAGLEPTVRNAKLDQIRREMDAQIGKGLSVILLGDLNTAASEPAFDRFVDGLRDVHEEVGFGPGWTWRPSRLEFLGIGLVRIDHILVSADVAPVSIGVACPPAGDHCLVSARIAIQ
jgi:endonuclease/exonuclease/phosphatase (EEP) superfamily protein YafD